ncbi:MAG TPA: RAMP superfamily CRISPR-associated protein, partial [Candidatus Brocadiaceae bacterium]|nr:RAMP superfamily CRISPR-associated protein [Candidatus Brocadiaceae bacterium]
MAKNGFRASRGIKRRFIVEAMLELTSPTHFGGPDPYDMLDMPIARDAATGNPILYGTTLAGLLRGVLSDRLSGHEKEESVFTFFGGGKNGEDDGVQSAFIVDDAFDKDAKDLIFTDIRDGVAIDHKTGVAQKGAKFDMELIRAGARFPLHFELLLDGSNDVELISCLLTCMDALEKGNVLLGARNRKGFGRCAIAQSYPNNCRWA